MQQLYWLLKTKEINAFVIGGTFNWHDVLHIQATKVGPNTVLSQIINLVATTQMSKALIQKFADYIYQRLQVLFVACTKMAAMASYLRLENDGNLLQNDC
uniref:Cation-transporting ATPase HMA5-like isoform X6 n=1 Tax=Cicer arietinum TaxID=3827 RepID=A0A3Q7XVM6_CICAR|nr:cation-transporting ATPase HMA5-like isoform X6 [Cicer arietinum]